MKQKYETTRFLTCWPMRPNAFSELGGGTAFIE